MAEFSWRACPRTRRQKIWLTLNSSSARVEAAETRCSALDDARPGDGKLLQNFNHQLAHREFLMRGMARSAHAVQDDIAGLNIIGQRAQELRGLRLVQAKSVLSRLLSALNGVHHVVPPRIVWTSQLTRVPAN